MHRAVQLSLWAFWIGGVLLSLSVAQQATAQDTAQDTVNTFHDGLLHVMQRAEQLGFAGRRAHLEPVIRSSFDVPRITQLVLGRRQWAGLTEEQRATMQKTFGELILATYAARFDSYSGEQFEVISERELKGDRTLIRSKLRPSNGAEHRLDYVLHRAEGQWRIINILADGVSDLALKRAEYGAIIQDEGFDSLITKLEEQISKLSKDASAKTNVKHISGSRGAAGDV